MSVEILDAAQDDLLELLVEIICSRLTTDKKRETLKPSGPSDSRRVALVYARKSVVKTRADQVSPERQVAMCTEAAEAHGWRVELYVDAEGHRSGGSEKHRPEWRRLKAQLSRPDVAAVVVADIARASRSPRDFYNFLDECNKRSVQFISLKQQIDTTTANGRAMLGISLIFSAWEREIASERASVAIGFKRDGGKHVGNAPFGTKRDDHGILVESEDWPATQQLFEAYATGKFTFYSLAVHLNAQGLRFRNRAHEHVPFDRSSIRSVISNVLTYAGYIVRGHGKAMMLPAGLDEQGDVIADLAQRVGAVRGGHAALINRETAQRVVLTRKRMHGGRIFRHKRTYILIPSLRCANCGQPMRGSVVLGVAKYIHAGRVCRRRAGLIDAETIERAALDHLKVLQLPPARVADLRRRIEDRMVNKPEAAELKVRIATLNQKHERLKDLYIEGDVDRARYDEQRRAITQALDALAGQLGEGGMHLDAVLAELGTLAEILKRGSPQQQRRAIADLFDHVEVDLSGKISRMVPKAWVRAVFGDIDAAPIEFTSKAIC